MLLHQTGYRRIILFWLPLAATWLMMALEGPFLAAVIARLSDVKFNLAAYGVAFSFALIIEAPIIMIMSASTALVKDSFSYLCMRNFTFMLNIMITAVMLIFLVPPLFHFVAGELIGLPPEVAKLTYYSTVMMLPWPGAIGYRRFYQGIMIRYNLTRRVAYGTVIRLVSMTLTALILFRFKSIPGAYVGALALSSGVVLEAITSRIMVHSVILRLCRETQSTQENNVLTYRSVWNFYYPLALTSIIGLAVQPIITFFMGQSRMPINSLAVLPVINSLVFIFRSMGLSYQEVGIVLIGSHGEGYRYLRNVAFFLAAMVTLLLSGIAFSDLSHFWFGKVSGLSAELVDFAIMPTRILTILPGLAVLLSFERSIMVHSANTKPITGATVLEVTGIVTVLLIGIYSLDMIGAQAAALAMILGRLAANLYLIRPAFRVAREFRKT